MKNDFENMDFLISENEHYIIEQCYSCAIPGYLILTPKFKASSIEELPKEYLDKLGENLAFTVKLVNDVIKPVKIYCAQFCEESDQIHFHIFPRTEHLTSKFLEEFPEQKELIHGPMLLDWARNKNKFKKEKVWEIVFPVINAMRKI